jgi:hypothetical protein
MQCILYKIYFWNGFSYVLQFDMHFICTPMWTKFYSCKKWVLQVLIFKEVEVSSLVEISTLMTKVSNRTLNPYSHYTAAPFVINPCDMN